MRIGQVQPLLVHDSGYKVRFPRKIFSLVDFKTFFIFTLTSAWDPLSWADKIFIFSTVTTQFQKSMHRISYYLLRFEQFKFAFQSIMEKWINSDENMEIYFKNLWAHWFCIGFISFIWTIFFLLRHFQLLLIPVSLC